MKSVGITVYITASVPDDTKLDDIYIHESLYEVPICGVDGATMNTFITETVEPLEE